jgi:radical SAM protein with 4Fe4S-binding SPASM domain
MADGLLAKEDYRRLFDCIRSCRQRHSKLPVTYGCCHYLTPAYEMDVRPYFFICGTGIMTASVLYNGDIFVCPDVERRAELIQGNIRKDRFAAVWREGFQPFRTRRDQLNPDCAACADAVYCRGDSVHTWDFASNSPRCCLKKMFEQ